MKNKESLREYEIEKQVVKTKNEGINCVGTAKILLPIILQFPSLFKNNQGERGKMAEE